MVQPRAAVHLGQLLAQGLAASPLENQRELAEMSSFSQTTVSDLLGGKRRVPWDTVRGIAQTINADSAWLAEVEQAWRAAKRAWTAQADRLEPETELGPALHALQKAQRAAAAALPYRLLTDRVPRLSDLYVEQHSYAEAASSTMTVNDALAEHRDLLLTASAGGGKTTLLHHLVLEPPPGKVVPVRVRAGDLVGRPLSAAIAATVHTELGEYLDAPMPEEVFRTAPASGLRWLVLVDGLDEIIDGAQRERVVDALAGRIAELPPSLRFLIASRPLAERDLEPLRRAGAAHFSLRPFDTGQLNSFAKRWFHAQQEADPDRAAARFLASVQQSRLESVVALPLLATIAAVVHSQSDSLSTSRAGLYAEFFQYLLDVRQRTCQARPVLVAALRPYRHGADIADWIFTNLIPLLEHLAAGKVLADQRERLSERAHAWVQQECPKPVDGVPEWRRHLEAMLIGTGVLTISGGGLEFTHHSFAEYLYAAAVADGLADEIRTGQVLGWVDRMRTPQLRGSALFAVGRWAAQDGHDAGPFVSRLVAGPPSWVVLAAELVADGIAVGSDVVSRLRTALVALAEQPVYAVGAVRALGRLPDREQVLPILRDLLATSGGSRWRAAEAARQLVAFGYHAEAVARLDALLAAGLPDVAVELARLGHKDRALARLNELADTGDLAVAQALAELGDHQQAARIAWRLRESNNPVALDVLAFLAKLGDGKAVHEILKNHPDELVGRRLLSQVFATGLWKQVASHVMLILVHHAPAVPECTLIIKNGEQERAAAELLDLIETTMVDSFGVQLDAVRMIHSLGLPNRAVLGLNRLLDSLPTPTDSYEWFDRVERARAAITDTLVFVLGDHAAAEHLGRVIVDAQRPRLSRLCAARSLTDLKQRDRAQSLLSDVIDQPLGLIDAAFGDDKDDILVALVQLTNKLWT